MTAASVFAADELDLARVNPVLVRLAEETISGDEQVQYTYPIFDTAYSSFAQERLKYDLQASIKNVNWMPGQGPMNATPTTIDGSVKIWAVRDADPAKVGIAFQSRVAVETDVLAFARYAASVALKEKSSSSPLFEQKINDHLEQLKVVANMNSLAILLNSGRLLTIEIVEQKLVEENAYLQCIRDHKCQGPDFDTAEANQLRRIQRWEDTRAGYRSTAISTQSEGGQVKAIEVSLPNGSLLLTRKSNVLIRPEAVRATLKARSVVTTVDGFSPQTTAKLDEQKARLMARLKGAQDGVANDHLEIQKEYRYNLIEFKKTINGQRSY